MNSNTKLLIVYILEILKEYSDENHPLKQNDIIEILDRQYNMACDRKSVGANVLLLQDLGYDIIKNGGGVFLGAREIDNSEISFLVDAIFSCRSISTKQSQELIKKVTQFVSMYDRKNYKYWVNANSVIKTDNKQVFYNISLLNEAIEKNKKVSFKYSRYYFDEAKNQSQQSKMFYVSPYFLVNSQGKYYLVCGFDKGDEIANYRIDNIRDIRMLDSDRRAIKEFKGFENEVDIAKYINKNPYMLALNEVRATIKLYGDYVENNVVDWFGKNVRMYKKDGTTFVDITFNEQSLIYWCLQYGAKVELVSPASTREKIKEILNQMNNNYK